MENYKEHLLELSVLNDLLQRGLKVLDLLEGRSQKEADVILNDFIVMSSILNERKQDASNSCSRYSTLFCFKHSILHFARISNITNFMDRAIQTNHNTGFGDRIKDVLDKKYV